MGRDSGGWEDNVELGFFDCEARTKRGEREEGGRVEGE